jgi:hypothetical protein
MVTTVTEFETFGSLAMNSDQKTTEAVKKNNGENEGRQ